MSTDESTFREMTVDHLGDEATEDDLARFVSACEQRQTLTGESDASVTEAVYRETVDSTYRGPTPRTPSTAERRHAAIQQLSDMSDEGEDWSVWTDCAWCGVSLDHPDVERSEQCEAICADCLPDDWPGSLRRERFELFGRFEYLPDPTL